VAAAGDLWTPSRERGIYKTTDGGKTWKAVLAASVPYGDRVGGGDIVLDPKDPQVLYAALYARRRTPWSFTASPDATDGKDLGGIFKTADGGTTWRKLGGGLQAGTGRIGLAVYAKDPKVVYAIVQSEEAGGTIDAVRSRRGGVFRSDDGGETWTRTSPLNPRPFYFSQIRVDPANDKRVYVLGFALHVSDDGGRSFREDLFEKVHPDNHALAIDPRDPKRLLLGTDGGPYQSYKAGEGWEHLSRMAAGEFYRINVDTQTPYRICGGLQDNQNWVGPSRTSSKDGIVNADWISLGGGDGFYCVFDATDPQVVYSESQSGTIQRMDLRNGQTKDLRPEPAEGSAAFRFHWNSPLIGSGHDPDVLYLAGNRVFELRARAEHWRPISPDLSMQDPRATTAVGSGAETFGVVFALAESPLAERGCPGRDGRREAVGHRERRRELDGSVHERAAPRARAWVSRIRARHWDAKVATRPSTPIAAATSGRSRIARVIWAGPGSRSRATCPPRGRSRSSARTPRTPRSCTRARSLDSSRASTAARAGCRSAASPPWPWTTSSFTRARATSSWPRTDAACSCSTMPGRWPRSRRKSWRKTRTSSGPGPRWPRTSSRVSRIGRAPSYLPRGQPAGRRDPDLPGRGRHRASPEDQ
jgi:hypothetical protein